MYWVGGIIVVVLFAWFAVSAYINNVEQAPYVLLAQKDGYEIRSYAPHLVIEVTTSGSFNDALNEGFRILASYIFGNNTAQTSVAMTAPVVAQKSEGEKVAMTAPVIAAKAGDTYRVQFIVPASYSRETLPLPNDPRIRVAEQPEERVAALRFGWYYNEARIERKTNELQALLDRDRIARAGEARFAGYNDPWAFPLLRKHEILVPLAETSE